MTFTDKQILADADRKILVTLIWYDLVYHYEDSERERALDAWIEKWRGAINEPK